MKKIRLFILKKLKATPNEKILEEWWKMRIWHSDERNQWAGVIHANTTINAIDSLKDRLIEPQTAGN
jgi:hypothetical protein